MTLVKKVGICSIVLLVVHVLSMFLVAYIWIVMEIVCTGMHADIGILTDI